MGVDHILSGFDHLTFVLALLLIVSGARRLLITVTSFTLAHSITLAAATLVGYGLSGFFVSWLGYQALFLFGASLLVVGAAISLLLPGMRTRASTATEALPVENVKALLRSRGLVVSYCAIFAQYFTFGSVVTLLPLYVRGLGMEAFHVGMLLAIFAVMFILVQFPSGAISDRAGRLAPTAAGLSLGLISLIALPSVNMFPLLAAAMALYGVAYGLLFPSISALIVDNTTPGERGVATGVFHALITTGVAAGAPLMGWAGEAVGVQTGLMLTAGVMLLALAVTLTTLITTLILNTLSDFLDQKAGLTELILFTILFPTIMTILAI